MTKCNKCNTENTENAKFCTSCGNSLKEVSKDKNTKTSEKSEENIEININLDFAKKWISIFKTLSKNEQKITFLLILAVILFFVGTLDNGSFYEYASKKIGFFDLYHTTPYNPSLFWIFIIIPFVMGIIQYLYNFKYTNTYTKLKFLLANSFLSMTSIIFWININFFDFKTTNIFYYIYFLSFVWIFILSYVEILNLFRKRK